MLKPTRDLLIRDWKPEEVYLVQFPRSHTVISPSPFAIKVETWLRMNGIKYQNVNNELTHASAKGQIPFVELNGRQFADSNFIIDSLCSHFKVCIDSRLSTNERAICRAFTILIEESLFRCLVYYRSIDCGWLATDQGWAVHLSAIQKFVFQYLKLRQFQGYLKQILHLQGYGRNSEAEIEEIAKKDLMAISTLLGDKPFLMGDQPTTLDATLFAHLVQFTDTPLPSNAVKLVLEKNTPNLLTFVKRMKQRFWPDWAKITQSLEMNPTGTPSPP